MWSMPNESPLHWRYLWRAWAAGRGPMAVPSLVAQRQIDIVIGNGENAAGGFGITPELAEELFDLGLAVITTGNHAWDKKEILDYFPRERTPTAAGQLSGVACRVTEVWWSSRPAEKQLGVLQLMGRAYMPTLDCPFQVAKKELAALKKRTVAAVIVDMHAEATSEKMAMGHYLDGEVDGRGRHPYACANGR